MPKSFLVKKRLRVKDSRSEEEESASKEEDERNIKSEETGFLGKTCGNKIHYPVVEKWTPRAPSGEATLNIEDEKSPAEGDTKLVNHEKKLQLESKNIILSHSFNSVHEPLATDEKQCNRCKRTYTTDSALMKHQRYYCNFFQTKSFACKYCDKVYLSLGALKMHIRTHTLPCRCMICGKAFSRPWLLQGHIRTHTGEKPYECSNCNRAFADRSNLRAHLQTHSDIKKYKCERCSRTFSRMSLLLKHQNACSSII